MSADPPLRSFRASLFAMLGICLAFILIALNTSVVGTAMPRIVADLRGFDLYQWSASAFLLGNAVMIPITGRLGDLYGRKRFVLLSVVLFAAASVACGLSQSMLQLVLARGWQGLAGGMLLGVASACVADLFPDAVQRVRWQVLMSSSYGVAMAVGPWMGGWMTEHAHWRWVFFINVPIALSGLVLVGRYFPQVVHHTLEDRSIDWAGAFLLLLALSALLGATEASHGEGLQAHLWGALLWLLTFSLGWLFLRHQYHTRAPVVPPALLDDTGARLLMLLGVVTGLTMFLLVFYAPLLLQGSFAQSADTAGLVMTPLLVCITLGSIVNGRLLPKVRRAERLIAWGHGFMVLGSLLLTQLHAQTPHWQMMLVFALCGVGLGFQLPNLTLQLMHVAGRANMGAAAALAQSTRMVGSMAGVGLASVLVNALYTQRVQGALQGLTPPSPALERLMQSPQLLVRAQDQEALLQLTQTLGLEAEPLLNVARLGLVDGTHAAFALCAIVAALGVALSLRLPRFDLHAQSPSSSRAAPNAPRDDAIEP